MDFDLQQLAQQLQGLDEGSIFLIALLSIAFLVFAVVILLRNLFTTRDTPAAELNGHSLRREKTVFDMPPAQGTIDQLNQSFDRLVLESGLNFTPVAAFLMLVAWSLLVGGMVFVFYENLLGAVFAATLALIALLVVLNIIRRRRMRQIREQVPYVADLLARGVRAGESLDQAIGMVGNETPGPLGGEFKRCSQQLDMGRSMTSVMRNLTSRVQLMETKVLASTLIVHRQTGGNLAVALDRMAQTIRDRINYQRQLRASTGAARTSAILIASITPIVFILLFAWQPDHMRELIEDTAGRALLLLAVVLEIVGILWVARLLKTD